jgi:sugar phosphate isomerase/epimerase
VERFVKMISWLELRCLFVPSHPIWLPSSSDVEARIAVSKRYLGDTGNSSIGFEAVQKSGSLSRGVFESQVSMAQRIRKELDGDGVETLFSVHAPYVPIEEFTLASESNDVRRRTIESVRACLELAEKIGARIVNTHLGGILSVTDKGFIVPALKEKTLSRVKDSVSDIVSFAEKKSVTVSIENVPFPLEELAEGYSPLIGVFPQDFARLVKDIDSKSLGVTIDFCHLWITYKTLREFLKVKNSESLFVGVEPEDYVGLASYESDSIDSYARDPFGSFLELLRGKVVHIHLADSDGLYVPGMSVVSEGGALGDGDLDLDSFKRSLKEIRQYSRKMGPVMIILEIREDDFDRPVNTMRSLVRLEKLIKSDPAV